jgi:hypothetical protein
MVSHGKPEIEVSTVVIVLGITITGDGVFCLVMNMDLLSMGHHQLMCLCFYGVFNSNLHFSRLNAVPQQRFVLMEVCLPNGKKQFIHTRLPSNLAMPFEKASIKQEAVMPEKLGLRPPIAAKPRTMQKDFVLCCTPVSQNDI